MLKTPETFKHLHNYYGQFSILNESNMHDFGQKEKTGEPTDGCDRLHMRGQINQDSGSGINDLK